VTAAQQVRWSGDGQFVSAQGIAVDPNGVFVGAAYNDRIQKFQQRR